MNAAAPDIDVNGEDLLRADDYEDLFEVAWAIVDAIETAALGIIAAKVIELGRGAGRRGGNHGQ